MSASKDLHNQRRNYTLHELTEENISASPYEQFVNWYDDAGKAELVEPNAMVLSTANSQGRPSSRIVLLKAFSERGFVFYTNYHSRKGNELEENPYACLLFFWDKLERQVRIEGKVEKVDVKMSDEYFSSRPFESRLSAIVSEQSSEVPSRKFLEERLALARQNEKVQRPENWGGYILKAGYFEFWQGRANRLHDRIVYQCCGHQWQITRLAP